MSQMSVLSIYTCNALAALALGALFITLGLIGPDWYKSEAELKCLPDYKVEVIYPDMGQCSKVLDALPNKGCGCSRPENPWARIYANYVVPLIIGLAGRLLLTGSIGIRVALLNAGFWGAIFILGIYYAFTNPEGIEGLLLSFGHLIFVAVIASAVLIVLHFLMRSVTRPRTK